MLVARENLAKDLRREIQNKCIGRKYETEYAKQISKVLVEKYGMSIGTASDIVSLRVDDLCVYSDFELFCVCKALEVNVAKYYTETEIKTYSASVEKGLDRRPFKFPIRIKAIKITEDQYIGFISAKTLCAFGSSGLINYNESTQRRMTKIIKEGEAVGYKITINKSAVESIIGLLEKGAYISDDITLNIADDSDGNFYYNDDTCELVIENIKFFDIIDGYHRYVAIQKECAKNPDFDYPMELRIVIYQKEKAQQFIWQKDQKTKMKKADSETMDQNKLSNRVIQRINQTSSSLLYQQVNMTGGLFDSSIMSAAIDRVYSSRVKKGEENLMAIKIAKTITDDFDCIVAENEEWLHKKYDLALTMCMIYVFSEGNGSLIEEIKNLYAYVSGRLTKKNPKAETVMKHITEYFSNDSNENNA